MTKSMSYNGILKKSDIRNNFQTAGVVWKLAAIHEIKLMQIGEHIVFLQDQADRLIAHINRYVEAHPKMHKNYAQYPCPCNA